MGADRVIIVGAGVGGLSAAAILAAQGLEVTVLEKAGAPGGKIRQVVAGGQPVDSGPTVFTMRPIFEAIFSEAGATLDAELDLKPLSILARHAWQGNQTLDLFADKDESADAISAFAGPKDGKGYLDFCKSAERIFKTLEDPFLKARKPSMFRPIRQRGLNAISDLWHLQPYTKLWGALGDFFTDPRLRQLFGRYSTYNGSSPYAAPATLMLIAHVEQMGVWLVDGGMQKIPEALARVASRHGAVMRCHAEVASIERSGGRIGAVTLADGERLEAEAILVNADASALGAGCFGPAVQGATTPVPAPARSLSALTWSMTAPAEGFPLIRHSVFFSNNYRAEFDDLFDRNRLPEDPTIYVCAQDRDDTDTERPDGAERLFVLVNAPATADRHPLSQAEIDACERQTFKRLEQCGLRIHRTEENAVRTTPQVFNGMFPATGGALYGRASHGWRAPFLRPTARTRLPGLYVAGGSTHPSAGVPMAALSGQLAAHTLMEDLASTSR
ncbi:MAG: 1-hydroxycarotenoid 3,4-desaturase CrtD [Alphaproteobacteria bacterium]